MDLNRRIWYAGKWCRWVRTVGSMDAAQALLDYFRGEGLTACAKSQSWGHLIYCEEPKIDKPIGG